MLSMKKGNSPSFYTGEYPQNSRINDHQYTLIKERYGTFFENTSETRNFVFFLKKITPKDKKRAIMTLCFYKTKGVIFLSKKLETFLNKELANLNVLYTKLNNYHWYVDGDQFFELHELFQTYYEEVAELIDEVAERNLIIGNSPIGSMKEYLAVATLEEETERGLDAKEMVRRVLKDFETLTSELKEGIEIADDEDDYTTEDFLIGILGTYEKHIWQLRAYLQK